MGSWNGTDAITQLPIYYGEEVRAVLLKRPARNPISDNDLVGFCYSHDLMIPYLLPICGTYNDYGAIKDIKENWAVRYLQDYIDDQNSERIFKEIERGKMVIENNNIAFMLIREDIYQQVLKIMGMQSCIEGTSIMGGTCNANDHNSFAQEIQKEARDFTRMLEKDDVERISLLMSNLKFRRLFGYTCEWDYASLWEDMCQKPDHFDETLNEMIEFFLLRCVMAQSRRLFIEQCGSGSQDDNWEMHRDLALRVVDICNAKIKEREEEWARWETEE